MARYFRDRFERRHRLERPVCVVIHGLAVLATAWLMPRSAAAQTPQVAPTRSFQARVDGTRVVANQGVDDNRLEVTVEIWGVLRDPAHFLTREVQLDSDPELELVVVSRQDGSGPYYRLQIVASRPDGIQTWSYASCGQPRLDPPRVGLGACTGDAGAAGTAAIDLEWYRLTSEGLARAAR